MVEQSLRKREVGGSSPSTGTSLPLTTKIGLTLVSIVGYALLTQAVYRLEGVGGFPSPSRWFHYVAGAIFGACAMAPYARGPHRVARGIALAIASAGIYWLAVWFVINGPHVYAAFVSLTVAGGLAAVLCGIAVVALAPQRPNGRLAWLPLLAGAVGGAGFELRIAFDENMLMPHAAWQLFVCLALHHSLEEGDASSRDTGERVR